MIRGDRNNNLFVEFVEQQEKKSFQLQLHPLASWGYPCSDQDLAAR